MAIASKQLKINDVCAAITTEDYDGCHSLIKNIGMHPVYLGNKKVTPQTGFVLEKNETINLMLAPSEMIYGIAETDKSTIVACLMMQNQ